MSCGRKMKKRHFLTTRLTYKGPFVSVHYLKIGHMTADVIPNGGCVRYDYGPSERHLLTRLRKRCHLAHPAHAENAQELSRRYCASQC